MYLLIHIYVFCGLKDILLWSPANFYDLILLIYVFIQPQYSILIYYCLFLNYFSYVFLLTSTTFIKCVPQTFQNFRFLLSWQLYSLNTLFTKTDLSWLIYESIKALEIKTSIFFSLVFPKSMIFYAFSSFSL